MGWRALVSDLLTPSGPDESAYQWLLIAVGHAVAGAALAALLPAQVPWPLLPIGYWLGKEVADLRRGGRLLDGLVDAGFVGLGTFYGAAWWPVAVLAAATGGALLRGLAKGERK